MITEDLNEYVINIRRDLHRHPELSGQEVRTLGRICEELGKLQIPYDMVEGKNIVARIENGNGREIAIRADFDALPVDEVTDVPWKSENPGVMHACGHDAHTATLLGAAKLLLADKDAWKGTVYLCFQHGEEIGRGAGEIVSYLKENTNTDAVFGAHMMSIIPPGYVVLSPGIAAAGAFFFKIHIRGKGGHSGRPDLAFSAAEIMCDIYQNLLRVPTNHHEAASTCVICPCMLHAGNKANIIPESAEIEGTARFLGTEDCSVIMDKIRTTAELTAAVHGGSVTVEFEIMAKYPVVNDAMITEAGQRAVNAAELKLMQAPPSTASDNFAEYLHEFPGFFCFVGSKPDRPGTSGIHHAPDFDLDESAIAKTSWVFYETVKDLTATK